MTMPRNYSSI